MLAPPLPSAPSVKAEARSRCVAPFRAAGFRCVAVGLVVGERELFARQKAAFEAEGKVVPDEVMAHLRGGLRGPVG